MLNYRCLAICFDHTLIVYFYFCFMIIFLFIFMPVVLCLIYLLLNFLLRERTVEVWNYDWSLGALLDALVLKLLFILKSTKVCWSLYLIFSTLLSYIHSIDLIKILLLWDFLPASPMIVKLKTSNVSFLHERILLKLWCPSLILTYFEAPWLNYIFYYRSASGCVVPWKTNLASI